MVKLDTKFTFRENLEILIKARYPYIWLVSHEEQRVERLLSEIASSGSRKKRFLTWTSTRGLVENGKTINPETAATGGAFDWIRETATAENGTTGVVVLFYDLHKALERDVVTYRLMRDLFPVLKASMTTVVVLSPLANLPVELQKCVAIVDVPLPKKEEFRPIIDRIFNGARSTNGGSTIKAPSKKDIEKSLEALQGLTEAEAENVVARSIVAKKMLDPSELVKEKEQVIRKSGILQYYESVETMDNIGGLSHLKSWIQKRSLAFSETAVKYGVRPPKGLFLAGLPGTGKSLTAKACASYLGVPLLMVNTAAIFGKYVGQSENQMADALKTASSVAPCVLFFDEGEKMFAGMSGGDSSGVTQKVGGIVLTWMQERPDGADKVFVIMTANNVFGLPPELFSRFDATFWVDLPTVPERKEIFAIQLKKYGRSPDKFDLSKLADASEGYSGREIEKIVGESVYTALSENPTNPPELNTTHILREIPKNRPLAMTRKGELDKLKEWGRDNAIPASEMSARADEKGGRRIEI